MGMGVHSMLYKHSRASLERDISLGRSRTPLSLRKLLDPCLWTWNALRKVHIAGLYAKRGFGQGNWYSGSVERLGASAGYIPFRTRNNFY